MWGEIFDSDVSSLREIRYNLHFAVQPMASASEFLAEKKPDFSHTSLSYNPSLKSFLSAGFSEKSLYTSLNLETFSLVLLSNDHKKLSQKKLNGIRLSDAMAWLTQAITENGVDCPLLGFPNYPDFPEHPLRDSGVFQLPQYKNFDSFHPLGQLYESTHSALSGFLNKNQMEFSIRVWPHHFDMATLVTLDGKEYAKDSSVGIGFSPGDTHYEEPYWYISPWPYPPKDSALHDFSSTGMWHTEGFTAAILQSTTLTKLPRQGAVLEDFIEDGFTLCHTLLRKNRS